LSNARLLFLLILVIFVGVFLTTIFLLNRILKPTVVQPIEKMARLAQVIRNDEKDDAVFHPDYLSGVASRRDELGNLAASLYDMSTELQKREQSLKDFAASLEKRVEERTGELQEVASALQGSNHELAKLNIELDDARKKAVEASEIKSNFLASVSHELRTPLNAIIGFSQLSLKGIGGELPEKHERNMSRIFANGRHLLSLINNLLDLAKIESGQTELIVEPFVLSEMINEVEQQTQGLAAEKGLQYDVSIDSNLPTTIQGDRDRIKQILINLVSNAIKFTETGAIKLNVATSGAGSWRLIVNDTGVGIPPHAITYIFDQFRQVDQTSTRRFGGTGLGLAIVKNLAALMNGTVKAESIIDQGSTFTVTLPLTPA
jgi:signal transduction histidine kinase